jgi:hypothetical protein
MSRKFDAQIHCVILTLSVPRKQIATGASTPS